MYLVELSLRNFRTYENLLLTFPREGALFCGANGSGKTNLLEAIHLLCTGRSQRKSKRIDMIRFNSDCFRIDGRFETMSHTAEDAGIGASRDNKLVLFRNNNSIASLVDWFGHTPVVSFSPEDLDLIYGPPKSRRQFCDMVLSSTSKAYLPALLAYHNALQNKNALLARGICDSQLDTYEEIMAETGFCIVTHRDAFAQFLGATVATIYENIAPHDHRASISYRSSLATNLDSAEGWKNVFLSNMYNGRSRDLTSGKTSVGPHRDDLICSINGKIARDFASQGQCRSFALALRLASVRYLKESGIASMIFLVDDAFSELDDARVSRLYPLLVEQGQLFIATPQANPIGINLSTRFSISASGTVTL